MGFLLFKHCKCKFINCGMNGRVCTCAPSLFAFLVLQLFVSKHYHSHYFHCLPPPPFPKTSGLTATARATTSLTETTAVAVIIAAVLPSTTIHLDRIIGGTTDPRTRVLLGVRTTPRKPSGRRTLRLSSWETWISKFRIRSWRTPFTRNSKSLANSTWNSATTAKRKSPTSVSGDRKARKRRSERDFAPFSSTARFTSTTPPSASATPEAEGEDAALRRMDTGEIAAPTSRFDRLSINCAVT